MPTKLTKDFVDEMLNMGERAIQRAERRARKRSPQIASLRAKRRPQMGFRERSR